MRDRLETGETAGGATGLTMVGAAACDGATGRGRGMVPG